MENQTIVFSYNAIVDNLGHVVGQLQCRRNRTENQSD
jgi:hypothetical protein